MSPGSGGSCGGSLVCSVLDQVTPCAGGHGAGDNVSGEGTGPVGQGGVAGGLVAVEQDLPDPGSAAAPCKVVPVSGVEPLGQAAVPQRLPRTSDLAWLCCKTESYGEVYRTRPRA
jgi:hypothetical protein